MKTLRVLLLIAGALALSGVSALAQTITCGAGTTVVNPTGVSFTASPDHNTVQTGTNTPYVSSYTLKMFKVSDGSLVGTPIDLGKNTPDASNIVTNANSVPQTMAKDVSFCATVTAVGPGGTTASAASGPFLFPGVIPPPRAPGAPTPR